MIDLKELEQYQSQLPYYGELLMKILMRKSEDKAFILEKLLIYLKANPKVQVLSIRNIDKESQRDLKFMLQVRFKCSNCKQISTEETNLMCFWSPGSVEHKPICETCRDRYRDYADESARDAAEEQAFEEKERRREEELNSLPIIEENDPEKYGKTIK